MFIPDITSMVNGVANISHVRDLARRLTVIGKLPETVRLANGPSMSLMDTAAYSGMVVLTVTVTKGYAVRMV